MKTKALLSKNKYALLSFTLLLMLSFIYDGFSDTSIIAVKVFACVAVSLFFVPHLSGDENGNGSIFLCAFCLIAVMAGNAIFLTRDIHILLSLSSFFLSLFFEEKFKYLTPVFAGICVLSQPLTVLFFAPAIILSLFAKKEKLLAISTAAICVGVFALTKALAETEFYLDQFSSYYLSVHLFYLSNEHTQALTQFLPCALPLSAVAAGYLVRLFLSGKKLMPVLIFVSILPSVFAFALSENTTTVFMILIPIFALMLSLKNTDGFSKAADEIEAFFKKHWFFGLLLIVWIASYPLTIGSYPYDSDFFSKATFTIFRQE